MGGSHRPRGITGGDTTRPAAGRQVGPVRVVGLSGLWCRVHWRWGGKHNRRSLPRGERGLCKARGGGRVGGRGGSCYRLWCFIHFIEFCMGRQMWTGVQIIVFFQVQSIVRLRIRFAFSP